MFTSQSISINKSTTQPTSTWYAQNGLSYFYHITGVGHDEVGWYNLLVKKLEDYSNNIPINDRCNSAVNLTIGEEMRGDSTKSRPHGFFKSDCSLIPTSRGLFYTFQGTGKAMSVILTSIIEDDSDDNYSNIRLEMAIILSNDDDCQTSSDCLVVNDFLTFEDTPHSILLEDTELDQTYVVVVSGEKFDDVGEFGILVDQVQQESNDGSTSSSASIGSIGSIGFSIKRRRHFSSLFNDFLVLGMAMFSFF